jgi:hypothetical protein
MNDKKKNTGKNDPIDDESKVKESNDERIDQDVPGFPHAPSKPEDIKKKKKDKDGKVNE